MVYVEALAEQHDTPVERFNALAETIKKITRRLILILYFQPLNLPIKPIMGNCGYRVSRMYFMLFQ